VASRLLCILVAALADGGSDFLVREANVKRTDLLALLSHSLSAAAADFLNECRPHDFALVQAEIVCLLFQVVRNTDTDRRHTLSECLSPYV
jgi:hypothetical protein